MASRADLEEQASRQAQVAAAAWVQMRAGWASLNLTAAALQTDAGRNAVVEVLGDLVLAWGEVAATLAADFYDEQRARSVEIDGYSALIPNPLNEAQVDGVVRRAVTPVASDASLPDDDLLDAMLNRLEGPTQRLVRQAQRDTIDQAATSDPRRARVARVPMGAKTCAFCMVLASRGYVYRSLEAAGRDRDFHDFCDCEQDLSWASTPEPPEGYDPGELYGRYEAARKTAGTGDLRQILKQLRLLEGIR